MAELRPSTILIPGLSALAGGALGALLTVSVMKTTAPRSDLRAQPEPVTETSQPAKTPLDGRVSALERSIQGLTLKESMARAAEPRAPSDGATPDKAPLPDVAPIVDNPVFEAAVRDVMERAEQERNVEREAERAEWRKRVADEWTSEVSTKLRLTEIQKTKVTEVANGFWEKLRDLRQNDAGPPLSRQERRERVDALRKSAEAELAKLLDPAQMTSYRELDESSRLGSQRSLRSNQRSGARGE